MNKLLRAVAVCLLGLSWSFSAQAFDGIKVAVGEGQNSTDTYQIALISDFGQSFFNDAIKLHWEFGFSYWDSDKVSNKDMEVLSVNPIFTYELGSRDQTFLPYVNFSIGIAYLSDTHIARKKLGQRVQFDDRLGLGVRFGNEKRHDIALNARHLSNAELADDNDGFNIYSISYSYRF